MLEAAFWGFVGGGSLIIGALLGLFLNVSHRTIGLVMGFGAGVLISAAAIELTLEAYEASGGVAAAAGLLAGSATFFAGDWLIDRSGGHRRKSPVHGGMPHPSGVASPPAGPLTTEAAPGSGATAVAASSSGAALVLGALLDGIPESAAIGISLLGGVGVSTAMVAAVFLSNVPESMSASTGLRASGRSTTWILTLWAAVAGASTLSAVLGYGLLGDAPPETVAFIQTFAAGAILTMVADTMLPEAVEHAGRLVGIVTVLGFATSFFLSAT